MAEQSGQTPAPTAAPTILVVEDEPQMRRLLRAILSNSGYVVTEATTGGEGLAHASARQPDVVLLDLGLPDIDGIDMTRQLRQWSDRPILVISARGNEDDKVRALDAGADDYVTKPFGAGELLARIRVALRHAAHVAGGPEPEVFTAGELRLDAAKRIVTVGDREVHLTPTEYTLLLALMKHAGKVLTHTHLLREVWGPSHAGQTHYLRVYMGQLRQKLEAVPARPRYLLTEPGVGYRVKAG